MRATRKLTDYSPLSWYESLVVRSGGTHEQFSIVEFRLGSGLLNRPRKVMKGFGQYVRMPREG